jgi:hypothetical protein
MPAYLIFALGALVGAGATLLAPGVSRNGRPMLKEAIKTALVLAREAQVRGAELLEMAEDLYAEAKAEASTTTAAAPRAARPAPAKRRRAPVRKAAAKSRPRTASRRAVKGATEAATATHA